MKQTILDVLRYLFEYYSGEETAFGLDQEHLQSRLREAGFEDNEILRAIQWLEELAILQEEGPQAENQFDPSIYSTGSR
jgi:Smg protein